MRRRDSRRSRDRRGSGYAQYWRRALKQVVGPSFFEELAPDADPAVVVGAPVGRSEPNASADRYVAVALVELVVNGSRCCVVSTVSRLGDKSKFLTLLEDSLTALERVGDNRAK